MKTTYWHQSCEANLEWIYSYIFQGWPKSSLKIFFEISYVKSFQIFSCYMRQKNPAEIRFVCTRSSLAMFLALLKQN